MIVPGCTCDIFDLGYRHHPHRARGGEGMSLHGPIKVNHQEVGYWSAQRVETGADGINTYRCQVDWTPEGFVRRSTGEAYPKVDALGQVTHAQRQTFTLRHDYRDGAVALAAKVLSELPRPTTTSEESDDE